jgi:beta-lactamase regulating signal transducer with metallopeptidase domain
MTQGIGGIVTSSATPAVRAFLLDSPILIDTALKGAVLLGCCLIAVRMLRFRSAAVRHLLWSTAVIGHLALPFVTWNVPPLHWEFLPPPPWIVASAHVAQSSGSVSASGPAAALAIVMLIWMAGVAVALLRIAAARRGMRELRRSSEAISTGRLRNALVRVQGRAAVTRRVGLGVTNRAVVPLVCGVISPLLLLPCDARTWPDAMVDAVLTHEIEHVRRLDTLTQFAVQCVLVVFWFDPLLWIAARYMRVERELACDDGVLRSGIDPCGYASHLIDLARWLRDAGNMARGRMFAAVAEIGVTETEHRIRALLDVSIDRRPAGNVLRTISLIGIVALDLAVGALRPFRWPDVHSPAATSAVEARTQGNR